MMTTNPHAYSPIIRLRNIQKSFGHRRVLQGVDLDVGRGEVVCLLGPSGSGKSTLLRSINCLEKIDRGVIEVGGRLIGHELVGRRLRELTPRQARAHRVDIGMVFQAFNLFPHLTVLQNIIEAPIAVRRLTRSEAVRRADSLLSMVGLSGRAHSYPRELSGGQKQRVAIARALAMQPTVMLFDEPTSALDPELVGEVLTVLKDLAAAGMTMVVVTHEISFAREVADKVAILDEGKIVEFGPARQVIECPGHDRTRSFLSRFAWKASD